MIGQLLDRRYQVMQVLGTGGFGQTYLAQDTRRPGNPICVVKHLKPASSDPRVFETAKRLFHSEAETLEQLGNHDQIPRLLAYFDENQEFYLVQEFIQGRPLSSELHPGQRWSEPLVMQMLQEVLSVLEFVHSQGVIHRDIKPDNIIRRASDNKLVLVDFGAVKQVRTQMVTAGVPTATVAIGTPGYMPTEQGQGKPRPNSDIYSLGIIAIQALTGRSPMELPEDPNTGEILWQHLVPVSPALAAMLTKMVRYHFKDRYQSATEALQALQQVTYGGGYIPPEYPNTPSSEPTLAVGGRRPDPTPQPIPQPTPQPPINTPVNQYSQSRSANSPDLLPLAIGALLTSLAVAGGVIAYRVLPMGSWFAGNRVSECKAVVVSGSNIRSAPTSSSRKNIITTLKDESSLLVTGKRTASGWMEVKLDGGQLAWVHTDVMANPSEVNSCLQAKGVDSQTVEPDAENAGRPPSVPEPEATTTPKPTTTAKPKPQPTVPPTKDDKTPAEGPKPSPTPTEDPAKIFQQARDKYDSGDLAGAIAELQKSQANIQQTLKTIQQWKQEWDAAQNTFNKLQQALNEGKWDEVLALRNDPQVTKVNKYWREQLDKLFKQAEQKIKEEADKAKQTPPGSENSPPPENPSPEANQ
ncbi:MAG: serine/threonine protein kinase [Nostocaceae cyanobacterium]|nr:serine/threonine protein kinase [Nostocaceae cyanobacterium]